MDDRRKAAYRIMLYGAMTQIRACLGHYDNPVLARHLSDCAYLIADVMHNLARFSAEDFAGFDEDWYWRYAEDAARFDPRVARFGDRARFERGLAAPGPPQDDPPPEATPRRLYAGKLTLVRTDRDGAER